jgi:hypothetical protein
MTYIIISMRICATGILAQAHESRSYFTAIQIEYTLWDPFHLSGCNIGPGAIKLNNFPVK